MPVRCTCHTYEYSLELVGPCDVLGSVSAVRATSTAYQPPVGLSYLPGRPSHHHPLKLFTYIFLFLLFYYKKRKVAFGGIWKDCTSFSNIGVCNHRPTN